AGLNPEVADSKGHAVPSVTTSLAVDSKGSHYVVWSTPSGLFYDDDATGTFGQPTQITKGQAFGGSIAVGADGTPWVSFYSGTTVKAGSRTGGSWSLGDVKGVGGSPGLPSVVTAIGVGSDGKAVVAFGD